MMPVNAVAEWILAQANIEGITLSGGEPLDQADSLMELIRLIRHERDFGVVCYTGHTIEKITDTRHRSLLDNVDLLIDGSYLQSAHADLLWRGSKNQRVHILTDRYRAEVEPLLSVSDRSAGMEFRIGSDGNPAFIGVPHVANFSHTLEQELLQRGIFLERQISS